MAEFESAFEFMIKHEGGYVCDPDDPGGETNFGLTKKSYPNLNIKDLDRSQAKEMYRRDWWSCKAYNRILSQPIADKLFDMSINMGEKRCFTILQQSLILLNKNVKVDGVMGSETIFAVNTTKDADLMHELISGCVAFYEELVRIRPSSKKFLKGWLNRANDVPSSGWISNLEISGES